MSFTRPKIFISKCAGSESLVFFIRKQYLSSVGKSVRRSRRRKLKRRIPSVPVSFNTLVGTRLCEAAFAESITRRCEVIKVFSFPTAITLELLNYWKKIMYRKRFSYYPYDCLDLGFNSIFVSSSLFGFIPVRPSLLRRAKTRRSRNVLLPELPPLIRRYKRIFVGLTSRKFYFVWNRAPFFMYWYKNWRSQEGALTPMGHAVAFRKGAFLFLADKFRERTFFTNIYTIGHRSTLLGRCIKKFKIEILRLYVRKNFLSKCCAAASLASLRKRLFSDLFYLFKAQTAFYNSRSNYYTLLRRSYILESFQKNIRAARIDLRCVVDSIKIELKRIAQRIANNKKKALLKMYRLQHREKQLAHKFASKLVRLMTKRGGRQRAFRGLEVLLHALKPTRKQEALIDRTNFLLKSPLLKAVNNLKTYFFLRKFTKRRKTIFIPGILPRRKRLRVAARWFVSSAKKQRERRLSERLLTVVNETARGAGLAKKLQISFNKSVKANKINLNPRRYRRRRRFVRRLPKRPPVWKRAIKLLIPKRRKRSREKPHWWKKKAHRIRINKRFVRRK